MARTTNNPRVVNRTVRAKLPIRRDPYWHLIAEGQHLGYRKTGEMQGSWIARLYTREHGRRFQAVGIADDTAPANGTTVLGFQEALQAAQDWFATVSRSDAAGTKVGPYTVKDAAQDWLRKWEGKDGQIPEDRKRSYGTAKANVDYHILPALGHIQLRKLTFKQIQNWLEDLAKKEPIKRQKHREAVAAKKLPPSRQSKVAYDPTSLETRRRREDTANRIFSDLRSLLNRAYKHGDVDSKAAWERVEPLKGSGETKNEYLRADEAIRFIQCSPVDFRQLVKAALFTGCRYDELCKLQVGAFDPRENKLTVLQSKTRKRKTIALTDEEGDFFRSMTQGKANDDLILLRSDGKAWGKSHQQHRMEAVLKAADIKRHVRFHDLRHTFASLLIQNGASIEVIANQLGHSGTAITIKHYAHLSPDYIANTVRANKPSFAAAS